MNKEFKKLYENIEYQLDTAKTDLLKLCDMYYDLENENELLKLKIEELECKETEKK